MNRIKLALTACACCTFLLSAHLLNAQTSNYSGLEQSSKKAPEYRHGAAYLDQGWDNDTTQWWYYVSQGAVFIPYAWFLALEQPVGEELFSAQDNLQRLGFLLNPPDEKYNPQGLPVGLAKQRLDLDKGPYQCWQGDWVGLTCAACHTGEVTYHGQRMRIEGGQAHPDIDVFQGELTAALAATASSRPRFARFAERVAASGAATDPQKLAQQFQCFTSAFAEQGSLFEAAQANSPEVPTGAGFGRLDAAQRGGNFLLAAPLGEPKNYVPTTAPVSYPAIWDTPYFDWVLYNGAVGQPLARNVIEALGAGSPFDPSTLMTDNFVHGVQMNNVIEIQKSLMNLKSPKWPESILGPINRTKAARGGEIYGQECASCHQVIDPDRHAPARTAGRPEGHQIATPSVAIDEISTDPGSAVRFAERKISLEKVGGPAEIPYKDAARILASKVVDQWIAASPANAKAAAEINRGRQNEIRAPLEYRTRPLNGIWSTAPYLHNGSVRSLYQLLLPKDQREAIFYMGSWEIDPKHVGVGSSSPSPTTTVFDTRLPGNSNAGHEYGTSLGKEDREALIEYLKTL
jgi:hypothetical protein